MAGRKSSRSSKTDHVLSLLSQAAPQEPAPADIQPPAATPEPSSEAPTDHVESPSTTPAPPSAAAPASSPAQRLSPPILEVARTNNEALEETIHLALEAALEDAVAADPASATPPQQSQPMPEFLSQPEPASESQSEPQSTSAPEPVLEPQLKFQPEPAPEPQPEPMSDLQPEPAPVQPQQPTVAVPVESYILTQLPDGARLINIMQHLVEEKVEHYAKMFHLCCCPRCLADSTALALSRLPAKYVVLPESAYRPMMSFYEAKFDSMVTAQIIYACKQVLESPRHTL